MKRIFKWESLNELLLALPHLLAFQGTAKTEINSLEFDSNGWIQMQITWHATAESEIHISEFGRSPDSGCRIMEGYASGYVSFCLDRPVYFSETTCRARGDRFCRALGKEETLWGEDASGFIRYFHAEDIEAKVSKLTNVLKKKMKELAKERKVARVYRSSTGWDWRKLKARHFSVFSISAAV